MKMDLRDGLPGWMWPAGFSVLAIVERLLGGLGVGRFFELANSEHNWLPEILAVSLAGYVGNKAQKKYLEIKRASLPAPEAYASRVTSSDDT